VKRPVGNDTAAGRGHFRVAFGNVATVRTGPRPSRKRHVSRASATYARATKIDFHDEAA